MRTFFSNKYIKKPFLKKGRNSHQIKKTRRGRRRGRSLARCPRRPACLIWQENVAEADCLHREVPEEQQTDVLVEGTGALGRHVEGGVRGEFQQRDRVEPVEVVVHDGARARHDLDGRADIDAASVGEGDIDARDEAYRIGGIGIPVDQSHHEDRGFFTRVDRHVDLAVHARLEHLLHRHAGEPRLQVLHRLEEVAVALERHGVEGLLRDLDVAGRVAAVAVGQVAVVAAFTRFDHVVAAHGGHGLDVAGGAAAVAVGDVAVIALLTHLHGVVAADGIGSLDVAVAVAAVAVGQVAVVAAFTRFDRAVAADRGERAATVAVAAAVAVADVAVATAVDVGRDARTRRLVRVAGAERAHAHDGQDGQPVDRKGLRLHGSLLLSVVAPGANHPLNTMRVFRPALSRSLTRSCSGICLGRNLYGPGHCV